MNKLYTAACTARNRQEPLSLPLTFKSTHDPLSISRRLMGKFCSVIGILTGIVNRILLLSVHVSLLSRLWTARGALGTGCFHIPATGIPSLSQGIRPSATPIVILQDGACQIKTIACRQRATKKGGAWPPLARPRRGTRRGRRRGIPRLIRTTPGSSGRGSSG